MAENKKVILHLIMSMNKGGAEGCLYRLVTFQVHHKHIILTLLPDGYYTHKLREIGIEVISLSSKRKKFSLVSLFRLIRYISYYKPDLIQSWMYHSNFLTIFLKLYFISLPIYWNIRHSNLIWPGTRFRTILIDRLCALFSSLVPKKIIYCGNNPKNVHEKVGYNTEKSIVIFNGFETKLPIYREQAIQKNKVKTFIIGCVARYDYQKDHENLFDAIRIFINETNISVKLVLAGTNVVPENNELVEKIAARNLLEHTALLGFLEDPSVVYRSIDCLVLSSSCGEGFPNVLAEAMLMGVPAISTDVGDASMIVLNDHFLVKPNSSSALADAMIHLWKQSQDLCYNYGDVSESCYRKIADNFSVEKMSQQYDECWVQK